MDLFALGSEISV